MALGSREDSSVSAVLNLLSLRFIHHLCESQEEMTNGT